MEWFGERRSLRVSSPLGPKGTLQVGGARPAPGSSTPRNDRYRIERWDILTGALSMVVERRTPPESPDGGGSDPRASVGRVLIPPGNETLELDPTDDRWAALDSLSIAEDFLLDDLGFLWVRRGPSPSEGDEGLTSEFTDYTGSSGRFCAPSGLHDVFRPDGVYLGTVQLPHDLEGP